MEQQAMQDDPRVSVVLPTLNEARNLPHVLARLPYEVFELILVDGHSSDGTVEVARALYPAVRVLQQPGRGKGDALRCGFRACRGEIVVTLDADGSTDAAEIPLFVAALRCGADFVKGTRFACGGGSVDLTRARAAGNRVLTGLVNLCFGARYTDLCYGFNAFWTHLLPSLRLTGAGFEIETEMHIRVAQLGLRVSEVPSREQRRLSGTSHLCAARDGWRIARAILAERLAMRASAYRYNDDSSVSPLHCTPDMSRSWQRRCRPQAGEDRVHPAGRLPRGTCDVVAEELRGV
jgi:glycosyltransferase involved in cell wall biosynthesis